MKPREITSGQFLVRIRKRHKMKQHTLATLAGCSKSMICMIEHDERSPSLLLSKAIVRQFPLGTVQRELLSWYLTKQHQKLEKLKHAFPNTYEDLRTSWLRKNKDCD